MPRARKEKESAAVPAAKKIKLVDAFAAAARATSEPSAPSLPKKRGCAKTDRSAAVSKTPKLKRGRSQAMQANHNEDNDHLDREVALMLNADADESQAHGDANVESEMLADQAVEPEEVAKHGHECAASDSNAKAEPQALADQGDTCVVSGQNAEVEPQALAEQGNACVMSESSAKVGPQAIAEQGNARAVLESNAKDELDKLADNGIQSVQTSGEDGADRSGQAPGPDSHVPTSVPACGTDAVATCSGQEGRRRAEVAEAAPAMPSLVAAAASATPTLLRG